MSFVKKRRLTKFAHVEFLIHMWKKKAKQIVNIYNSYVKINFLCRNLHSFEKKKAICF